MGKGVIAKKKKAPSIHSRAARRATSPGIDTDKSLKNVQPPAESADYRPSVLSIHQGAGVTKKVKKGRNMSTKARRKHEKEQDRAATILERTEKKVAKSKGQARTMQSRRKAWDDINNQVPAKKKKSQEVNGEEEEEEVSDFDEEMDDAQVQKAPEGDATTYKDPSHDAMEEEEYDGIL
ncbi:Alb1-domain-containing protein [Hypoxylon crocopeplum]|nr:Alb1-domain-containing protein [Hypoxylon crocopeplum]